jgi:hypothetical protein
MACGQSFGCDGRCRLTGICPDYAPLGRYQSGVAGQQDVSAQQRTMTDWHEHFRLHREMTADDLGLPLLLWDIDWLQATCGDCQGPPWMWFTSAPVAAPYLFWLGKDHG